jgi:hypothetical protein
MIQIRRVISKFDCLLKMYEGKGTLLEDLSDYDNNGAISDDDRWIADGNHFL